MTTWTPTRGGPMKAIVTRASDLNRFVDRPAFLELESLDSLRLLLMQVENPLLILFAPEDRAPAEIEIMVYDDSIEGNVSFDDDEDY
jgi:hypothetical protein